eukprot:6184737-Pleurochrysis_carterae.AAC.1
MTVLRSTTTDTLASEIQLDCDISGLVTTLPCFAADRKNARSKAAGIGFGRRRSWHHPAPYCHAAGISLARHLLAPRRGGAGAQDDRWVRLPHCASYCEAVAPPRSRQFDRASLDCRVSAARSSRVGCIARRQALADRPCDA